MRSVEVLDRETGRKTRMLWIDAKEAARNDPGRYEICGKPEKTLIRAVSERHGGGGAASVGKLVFEPE